ncbi:MAG: Gfo/Idh/MocA family oxidoreductase [Fimbriimonadales bacterium]|nr:Gfo/Idh/MocA family oxidoreductase [Fimbriimonadales bacterium]MDW8051472.1 Gfo/Idh/MocA family oxidoreductase [Armatimonadota bacterium]
MDKVRLGIIGSGGMARHHINILQEVSEAEIVAITEPSQDQRNATLQRFPDLQNVPFFDDYREMLEKVALDGVLIITPHTLHFEQAMAALDKGLHVMIEKPMVCTLEHAQALVRRFRETGKVGLVAYQRHYIPIYRYVYEGIRRGEIGEVHFVQAINLQHWLYLTSNTWRQDPALSGGGQINDTGSHLVDFLTWIVPAPATKVSAYMQYFDRKVDINSALAFEFANGTIGNLSVIGSTTVGWQEEITVVGSEATYLIRQDQLEIVDARGNRYRPEQLPAGSQPVINFVNAILGREEVQSKPEDGLRVIAFTEAAWESARQGGVPVPVPQPTI